jgi:hypothetical protein
MAEARHGAARLGERRGELGLALAGAMIAVGGLLLGLQVDARGTLCGTGFTPLALGGLVALLASAIQIGNGARLPRDPMTATGAALGFLGMAFLVGGVLAPGGAWMFWELVVLVWVLARRRRKLRDGSGPDLGLAGIGLLALMLIFRIWITWQASRHAWQLFTVDVPFLSVLPFAWLEPVKTITVGEFTQHEMGFPPTGLNFSVSMILWSAGFALCAFGCWARAEASREVEIERVHDLIETLPAGTVMIVHRLMPETEWEALGLLGLPQHRLARRIESLVLERVERQAQLESALTGLRLLDSPSQGGFPAAIHQALARPRLVAAPELRGKEEES